MQKFKNVNELVNTLKPDYPVYCIRPESIKTSTKFFKNNFPGKVLYAVKTNPNEEVLKHIISNGINNFDAASVNEILLIKNLKPSFSLISLKLNNKIYSPAQLKGVKSFSYKKNMFNLHKSLDRHLKTSYRLTNKK